MLLRLKTPLQEELIRKGIEITQKEIKPASLGPSATPQRAVVPDRPAPCFLAAARSTFNQRIPSRRLSPGLPAFPPFLANARSLKYSLMQGKEIVGISRPYPCAHGPCIWVWKSYSRIKTRFRCRGSNSSCPQAKLALRRRKNRAALHPTLAAA